MRVAVRTALICILIVTACSLWAQIPVDVEVVRKSVAFLFAANRDGSVDSSHPLGTGFLIEIPLKDHKRAYRVFVTARHIVDPVWACSSDHNPNRIYMRVNAKDYDPAKDDLGVAYIGLDLITPRGEKHYYTSVDDSVDAAVIFLNASVVSPEKYDLVAVSLNQFATVQELRSVDAGVQVLSAGLLPAFIGVRRNYPVFKFGHISAVPRERIQVPCRTGEPKLVWLWLVAANLVPGNSGSPIISVPPLFSGKRPALIGLQSISFDDADVAGMTPSNYIFEAIERIGLEDGDLTRGAPAAPLVPKESENSSHRSE